METELFSITIDKKIRIKTFYFISLFTYFWLHWVFIAVQGLSSVSAGRGYSLHRGVLASHCGDFSCCRAWSLGWAGFRSYGSQPLKHRLSSCYAGPAAPWHVGSSGLGAKSTSPALTGRFVTTELPGKSRIFFFNSFFQRLSESFPSSLSFKFEFWLTHEISS